MADFKNAGEFKQTTIPLNVPDHFAGLVDQTGHAVKLTEYKGGELGEIRHPIWRLRNEQSRETAHIIGAQDISKYRLQPYPLSALPKSQKPGLLGAEVEYTVITPDGQLFSAYGDSQVKAVHKDSSTPSGFRAEITHGVDPWLLDRGFSAEAQRHQVEVGIFPASSFQGVRQNYLRALAEPYQATQEQKVYLVPTGDSGHQLLRGSWEHVSPHPYIVNIQALSQETIQDFNCGAIQTHVDLEPYDYNLSFGLFTANRYNDLFATMLHGLGTASPFRHGRITPYLSTREFSRRQLITRGGVKPNVTEDPYEYLHTANATVQAGTVPSVERGWIYPGLGNGSHADHRLKGMGTMEFGSSDSNPYIDWVAAHAVMANQFVRMSAAVVRGEAQFPNFMVNIPYQCRVSNREKSSLYGNNARLWTPRGTMPIAEAWQSFITWASPTQPDEDWNQAVEVVNRMLTPHQTTGQYVIENGLDHRHPDYGRGNFGARQQAFVATLPPEMPDQQKIDLANIATGKGFQRDLDHQLRHKQMI